MSSGKKLADLAYKTFAVSMVGLTVYGTLVLGSRFYNMMEARKERQKALLTAANLDGVGGVEAEAVKS